MEEKFNAHPAVSEAVITFSTKQLRLAAEDPDALIPELQELARTVEPEIAITPREAYNDEGGGKSSGQEHGHKAGTLEKIPEQTILTYGSVLFAAGLIMDHFGVTGLSMICCVIAYILLGRQIVATAVKNMVTGHIFDENFLMSVATLGAGWVSFLNTGRWNAAGNRSWKPLISGPKP